MVFRDYPRGDAQGPAGVIGIWDAELKGEPISEMGWMILPAFRGRGVATKAGRMVLERARSEKRWRASSR
ncbi:MAG TPA: GNAT family N-acetyltransferase [Elusimicrobiota bacterium]|nr:GNAT family N-acetyltransferase [Elusimicrobiota bacterium]